MSNDKRPNGRPRNKNFKTPQALQRKFEEYFLFCEIAERVPNIMGMCVFLECDRDSLLYYEKKDDFLGIIKAAKERAYDEKFQAVFQGKGNPTVFIFDAINNHGMINTRSEQKSELTGKDGERLIPADTITPEERVVLQQIAQNYTKTLIEG